MARPRRPTTYEGLSFCGLVLLKAYWRDRVKITQSRHAPERMQNIISTVKNVRRFRANVSTVYPPSIFTPTSRPQRTSRQYRFNLFIYGKFWNSDTPPLPPINPLIFRRRRTTIIIITIIIVIVIVIIIIMI